MRLVGSWLPNHTQSSALAHVRGLTGASSCWVVAFLGLQNQLVYSGDLGICTGRVSLTMTMAFGCSGVNSSY